MFGNLGFGELMVIMVIVLVLFGAKRVPEISASFGKGIREFKGALNHLGDDEPSTTTTPAPTPPPAPTQAPSTPALTSAQRSSSAEPNPAHAL